MADVIIAMPTAPGHVLRTLARVCAENGLTSLTMPGVFELLDGNVSVTRLRRIEITDLLRRSQVTPDQNASSYIAGRPVLITGAGGSIGSELCRQVARAAPSHLALLGHGENSIFDIHVQLREQFPSLTITPVIADIRDNVRLTQVFQRLAPAIVFHAAAHKHVPLMEDNPEEAISNNVTGTRNLAEASFTCGVERFVLISSDKAVSPRSVMGASKRMAERIVRDAARRRKGAYTVVRFGNVLGSRGSVVPFFNRQIERGGPITVTHPDMKRFFMTIPEAVHLVLQAGGLARGGELFALNMGEPIRIVDLAADLVRLSGFTPGDIPVVFTGMRPGEKLIEALWEEGARSEPTANPDVFRVIEDEYIDSVELARQVRALETASREGDAMTIQVMLADSIATFAPTPRPVAVRAES